MKAKPLLILILAIVLSSCTADLNDSYVFSDAGELISDENADMLRLSGFASSLCVPDGDTDLNTDGVDALAFGLFSLSDKRLISGSHIYEKMYPASTTKILTALLAIKYSDPDEIVTVPDLSSSQISGSSLAGLSKGDTILMRDLLYALMVPSGNDAAVAIASHIAGSEEAFSVLMNEEAGRLGATHSHFVNPNGLPDTDHFTTVYDMYLIFNEALNYDEFKEISSTYEYSCEINKYPGSVNDKKTLSFSSGNAFLSGKYSLPEGFSLVAGKTGHTNAAGFCLVLSETDQEKDTFISIIFNSYIYEELYASMKNLISKASAA